MQKKLCVVLFASLYTWCFVLKYLKVLRPTFFIEKNKKIIQKHKNYSFFSRGRSDNSGQANPLGSQKKKIAID